MQVCNQLNQCCEWYGESKTITPHNQPQKRIPTVAATGPILTRLAMNFGISTFAQTTWSKRMVKVMTIYGPVC